MEKDNNNKVWFLIKTDYVGQCTGFSYFESVLGVFLTKPCVQEVAPFIGNHLSSNMGEAIAELMNLVDTNEFSPQPDVSFEFREVSIGEKLDEGV